MNRNRLSRLKDELRAFRRSPQKARAIEGLAKKLGRRHVDRGKEPVWENSIFPFLRPLSIPHHGGRDLSRGTQKSVLDQLEDDILAWEEILEEDENG